jgi:light-regulated signal transduction histidine kinase (bacteriophytochrome)/CheY-like chemotaxis protein
MSDTEPSPPAPQVDLSNCDREPIHILGRVQYYGCLIALSSDWIIAHASENCDAILGHSAESILGTRFIDLFSQEAVHFLRTRIQVLSYQPGAARAFAYPLFGDERLFDISIHNGKRHLIFEFEPRIGPSRQLEEAGDVQALIGRVQHQGSLEKMAQEAARGLRLLSGFDRVMVYRFEEDDSGTVIAEALERGQKPYLGLRFPASDIPAQARKLYTRSPLRIIPDVDGPTHRIVPEVDPNGEPLDLSLAVTRAVSPIHLEYLRNMGVAASMSVSILRRGKLWGLFACHHSTPLYIDYEKRSSVELFAQLFNYELAQVEMDSELRDVDRARSLHDRMMAQLSSGHRIHEALEHLAEDIRQVIPFDGAAIYSEGAYTAIGSTPTREEFLGLARFLNTAPASQIYATENIGQRYSNGQAFVDRAAGLLSLPISRTPRDYLVLFRRELARSVTWAGSPEKPAEIGPNGIRLTPRKSFEAWQEVVRGQSAPWKAGEKRAAEALRVTLLEVVLTLTEESNVVRKRAQDQQELLIAELNHRVRNILGLIRGLVSQGNDEATSVHAYRSVLDARIHSLARAHDQLTQTEWDWAPLRPLIDTEAKAFLSQKYSRLTVSGDSIDLTPTAFTTVALLVHELVTNSAKHGSFSDSSGSVTVDVELQENGNAVIRWREHNGPPVKPPTRKGFGTTIIERSIPFELQGEVDVRYKVTGFEGDFTLPARHVRRAREDALVEMLPVASGSNSASLSGNALVLEDNMIIALDAVDMLTALGAQHVSTASRVADAMRILDQGDIEFALVDVNLGDEMSLPVVERCKAEGIPVFLATGYGANADIVSQFPGIPVIRKPYKIEHLRAAFSEHPPFGPGNR